MHTHKSDQLQQEVPSDNKQNMRWLGIQNEESSRFWVNLLHAGDSAGLQGKNSKASAEG